MELPNTKTTVKDSTNNITYEIIAYRQLSEMEARQMINLYLSQNKSPKKGKKIIIQTIIGHDS